MCQAKQAIARGCLQRYERFAEDVSSETRDSFEDVSGDTRDALEDVSLSLSLSLSLSPRPTPRAYP
eukprot:1047224-Pyramimonas_sp.AAC.1